MTAPSNTYDVIVVGGGISGRYNMKKVNNVKHDALRDGGKRCRSIVSCSGLMRFV